MLVAAVERACGAPADPIEGVGAVESRSAKCSKVGAKFSWSLTSFWRLVCCRCGRPEEYPLGLRKWVARECRAVEVVDASTRRGQKWPETPQFVVNPH